MATRNRYIPKRAVHPGEVLNEELISRGIPKKDFAKAIGIPASNLSEYLKGRRIFTPEFSLRIEGVLPRITADEWLRLQDRYELTKLRVEELDSAEKIARASENAVDELINTKELFSRIGVHFYTARERLDYLKGLLHSLSLSDFTEIGVKTIGAFKGSDRQNVDERNLRTWLLLARIACKSEAEGLHEFTEESGVNFSTQISAGINSDTLSEKDIKTLARENGIGYTVVPHLKKVPVDAYSTWVDDNPIIVVTYLNNDLHRLAFDILHEMGHILKHQGKTFISLDCEHYDKQGEVEREANTFAEDALIPPHIWKRICRAETSVGQTINTIKREAIRYNISPDIALRRYSKETNNYRIRGLKRVKVRQE